MTPLAREVLKDLTLPRARRVFDDPLAVLPRMQEAHCFEITRLEPLIIDLLQQYWDGKLVAAKMKYLFLPAPVTCLDMKIESSERIAFLLIEDGYEAAVYFVWSRTKRIDRLGYIGLPHNIVPPNEYTDITIDPEDGITETPSFARMESAETLLERVQLALLMINQPKLLGRRQHMPHRGLERQLLKARGITGKFPLLAWTEIFLDCGSPKFAGGESHEAHLTGRRCLHFVRAHPRVRRGRFEIVRAHWRGDASLGMKRSRYICRPKRDH